MEKLRILAMLAAIIVTCDGIVVKTSDRRRNRKHRRPMPNTYNGSKTYIDPGKNDSRFPVDLAPLPEPEILDSSVDLTRFMRNCRTAKNIKSVFSGMFLSSDELDVYVTEAKDEINPARRSLNQAPKNYVQSRRVSKVLGTSSGTSSSSKTDDPCCATRFEITAPGKVMVDGQQMVVVHMNHSYQYVQEGSCTRPAASCRDIGICTQIYKYAFLLMYDPELQGKVYPPVRYGRAQIKSHCECLNVGSIMK